jgi:hypothetical protein
VAAVGPVHGQLVQVLDLDQLLSAGELALLESTVVDSSSNGAPAPNSPEGAGQ